MKLTLSILLALGITISLNASEEFPNIEPYAVEEAPVVVEVEPEIMLDEKPIEEAVEEEKTNSQDEVAKDDDNDGIINKKDQCPDTSKDFMVDGYGCPQTMVLKINFPSGKAEVTEEVIEDVKNFAQFLQDNTGYQVIIYGHTDTSGSEDLNEKLSKARADAVKQVLVRYGIDELRLTAIGKGGLEPLEENETPEGRAKNRRIEIELIQ